MKKSIYHILVFIMVLSVTQLSAQKKASPPASATGEIAGASIEINYHQPSAKDREIMGDLVPYGKVWRTGANDATTIEVSEDVKVEGKELPAGKYALFTLPGEKEWVIIFNKTAKQWGAYDYKEADDQLRVKVKPTKTDEFVETFTIDIEDSYIWMAWENTLVKFKVSD